MPKIRLELKNYKLLKDLKIEIGDESNLYLIKGKNESGKTSILQGFLSLLTIKNDVPEAVTRGEQQATVQGEIPGPEGTYFVNMNITAGGTTFTMYDPNGMKISRIGDMRSIFEYNSMTVEDFIKKSYSTEGRRAQINTLSSLLDSMDADEFNMLQKSINTRTGDLFLKRRDNKKVVDDFNNTINSSKVSKEDEDWYNSSNKIFEILPKLREQLITISSIPSKEAEIQILDEKLINDKRLFETSIANDKQILESNTKRIEDLKKEIINLEANEKTISARIISNTNDLLELQGNYEENIKASAKREDTEIEKANLSKEITSLEEQQIKAIGLKTRIDIVNGVKDKLDKANSELKVSDGLLTRARNKILTLIKKISIPGYDLTIEDDVIYIDGYPLNENQIADSKLIIAVSAILAKVNKKSPMLIVGKLAELDNESLTKLESIAKDNNCIIVGDYVQSGIEDIVVEGFINKEGELAPQQESPIENKEQSNFNEM